MEDPLPHLEGVDHRFVSIQGLTLHYAEAGRGDPLVLLHGWPQHWYMWRHQIPHLAQQYRVLCPDLRGFGWSDAPSTGYEKEQLANDVIGLLDALKIGRFRLMGHDWGGWIGFLLCLRHPQRIPRYLALNSPHPFQKLDRRAVVLWRFWYQGLIASPLLGRWLVGTHPAFVGRVLHWGLVHKRWTDEEVNTYASRLKEPARAHASVMLYRSFLLREFIPTIRGRYLAPRLSTPALILFGVRDFALSPKLLQGYEPYADDLKVELIPDCGHFIAEEQPELVTGRALEFFAG